MKCSSRSSTHAHRISKHFYSTKMLPRTKSDLVRRLKWRTRRCTARLQDVLLTTMIGGAARRCLTRAGQKHSCSLRRAPLKSNSIVAGSSGNPLRERLEARRACRAAKRSRASEPFSLKNGHLPCQIGRFGAEILDFHFLENQCISLNILCSDRFPMILVQPDHS